MPRIKFYLTKIKRVGFAHSCLYSASCLLLGSTFLSTLVSPALGEVNYFAEGSAWATGSGYSSVNSVSSDGSVLVGLARDSANVQRAFRWTAGGGLVNLTEGSAWATGSNGSGSRFVSSDGSVVVGYAADSANLRRAFRWTAGGGLVNIAEGSTWATGSNGSEVRSMSGDGSVVVGYTADSANLRRAFRWTAGGGLVNLTEGSAWATGNFSSALSISGDGSVVVGYAAEGNYGKAFRWTVGGGLVNLAEGTWATGGRDSSAGFVTSDGSVVAGYAADSANLRRAFRWTAGGGLVNLTEGSTWATGSYYGRENSIVTSISSDGSVVIGWAYDSANVQRAFRWTAGGGLANLTEGSAWATGSNRSSATFVSSDGSVVVGYAPDSGNMYRAFRWTAGGGLANLTEGSAWATSSSGYSVSSVSSDGSVIVGFEGDFFNAKALLWTADGGLIDILAGDDWSTSLDDPFVRLSSDGSVVTGVAKDSANNRRPFMYTIGGGGVALDIMNTQAQVLRSAADQGSAIASVSAGLNAAVQTFSNYDLDTSKSENSNFSFNAASQNTPMIIKIGALNSSNKTPVTILINVSNSSNDDTEDLSVASIAALTKTETDLTVGGFVSVSDDGQNLASFGFDGIFASVGAFVKGDLESIPGLGWNTSLARSAGDVVITRSANLSGVESAKGDTSLRSTAITAGIDYTIKTEDMTIVPFLRLSNSTTTRNTYVEGASASFPISYDKNEEKVTTALLGLNVNSKINKKYDFTFGVGAETDLHRRGSSITGTSSIPGMENFIVSAPSVLNEIRGHLNTGVTRSLENGKTLSFGASLIQSAFSHNATMTAGVSYQLKF